MGRQYRSESLSVEVCFSLFLYCLRLASTILRHILMPCPLWPGIKTARSSENAGNIPTTRHNLALCFHSSNSISIHIDSRRYNLESHFRQILHTSSRTMRIGFHIRYDTLFNDALIFKAPAVPCSSPLKAAVFFNTWSHNSLVLGLRMFQYK